MVNPNGMIPPEPIAKLLGVESGSAMDLIVETGRVVATPVSTGLRQGWEADAKRIGNESLGVEAEAWLSFGNNHNEQLDW
jgi:antitoxin MazE